MVKGDTWRVIRKPDTLADLLRPFSDLPVQQYLEWNVGLLRSKRFNKTTYLLNLFENIFLQLVFFWYFWLLCVYYDRVCANPCMHACVRVMGRHEEHMLRKVVMADIQVKGKIRPKTGWKDAHRRDFNSTELKAGEQMDRETYSRKSVSLSDSCLFPITCYRFRPQSISFTFRTWSSLGRRTAWLIWRLGLWLLQWNGSSPWLRSLSQPYIAASSVM